jgi:hypothetical protein
MSMENINSIGQDFEEFLSTRAFGGEILPDTMAKIIPDIEKILADAASLEDAKNKMEAVYGLICDHQETAYAQGIKDGFNLALHLLGMAPENKKEVSQ